MRGLIEKCKYFSVIANRGKNPVPYKSKIVTFNYEQAKGPFKNSYHNKVSK